ncbi:SHOCT domain-containing protein [Halococcus salifodinae]|nr:SHOCT domain-containing protein [Halococcus salifodinae]
MPAQNPTQEMLKNEDHWFTLIVAVVTVGGLALISNLPWFWLLVVGMVVSGVIEFAIKEIPSDPENYDPEQYRLWDAGFGRDSEISDDERRNRPYAENRATGSESGRSTPDGLEALRDRYARGELTEDQFKRKVDHLLETDTPENAANWRETEREALQK